MSEETLSTELTRRAEDVHGAPLTFEQVRGRAHRIRRRRRAAASGAAAAVVAAAIVVPAVLSGGTGSSAPQPAPQPDAPGVSVLHDGVVTEPDGTTVRIGVDNGDVSSYGVLADGRVVVAMQQPYAVRVYAADGSLDGQYDVAANVVTMNPEGEAAAWVGADDQVQVLASGSADPTSLGRFPVSNEGAGMIDAVLDPEHLLIGDGATTAGELTPEGFDELRLPEGRVVDVSPDGGLWALQLVPVNDQQYGCSALYDPAAGDVMSRSCKASSLRFSPDGRHLVSAFYENNMAGGISVVDLDLQPVGAFKPDGRTAAVSRVGWADTSHLLMGVGDWRSSRWTLVRVGLDGTDPETLAGPVAGANPEMTSEFMLSD